MVAWSFNINVTYDDEMLCVGPQEVGERLKTTTRVEKGINHLWTHEQRDAL
jgi:hypothetical protein